MRQRFLPQNRIFGTSKQAYEQESVSLRALSQVLLLQEEPVGASGNASRGQANRHDREECEDEARVRVLSGEIRIQGITEEAHEEPAWIRRAHSGEASVRSVRCGIIIDETFTGAQTKSRGREDLQMRHVQQEIRQQGEFEYSRANAHGQEALRVSAVRQKFHAENIVGSTFAVSLGTETLSVCGLRQGIRVQYFAQATSQNARENRAIEYTMRQ